MCLIIINNEGALKYINMTCVSEDEDTFKFSYT